MGHRDKRCEYCNFPIHDRCCGKRTGDLLDDLRQSLKMKADRVEELEMVCAISFNALSDRKVVKEWPALESVVKRLKECGAPSGIRSHPQDEPPPGEHGKLKSQLSDALFEICEWKVASGLERGGDPEGVTPEDLRLFISEMSQAVKRHRERQSKKRDSGGAKESPVWKTDDDWDGNTRTICSSQLVDVELQNTERGATMKVHVVMPDGVIVRHYYLENMLDD